MVFREYDKERDRLAAQRIWLEIGWLEDNDEQKNGLDEFISCSRALVADLDGSAECLCLSMPAEIRHCDTTINSSAVMAVTVGRVARKRGLGKRLTAKLIADSVIHENSALSCLGIFDQGYYDLLGFGMGSYEHIITFDPATLNVKGDFAIPCRLSVKDWEDVHKSLLNRQKKHGACSILAAESVKAEMRWTSGGFGLGYRGQDGQVTHFFWGKASGENGPYRITAMAWQSPEQFIELLALLKSLGDQVRSVKMVEPAGVQMQDYLNQPFRFRQLSGKSEHASGNTALAFWQIRINDLAKCIDAVKLEKAEIEFNLELDDPIASALDETSAWRGIAGQYYLKLAGESNVQAGFKPGLPVLRASVGAFSRWWFGVLPASTLALNGNFEADPALLKKLDQSYHLPLPKMGWEY
jgi:hypothetical protein